MGSLCPLVAQARFFFKVTLCCFLLNGSCSQRKLLTHITLQSRRGWCYRSMWVILGHSAVVTQKSGQPVPRLERGTLSWCARPLTTSASPKVSQFAILSFLINCLYNMFKFSDIYSISKFDSFFYLSRQLLAYFIEKRIAYVPVRLGLAFILPTTLGGQTYESNIYHKCSLDKSELCRGSHLHLTELSDCVCSV